MTHAPRSTQRLAVRPRAEHVKRIEAVDFASRVFTAAARWGGIALGATLLLNSSASAQNALGAGNALDANRRVGGSGGNLPRAVENFASRNDLVTGNVADGKQFRGRVGYTSPMAFRGLAGSDALFPFRADSALSSPSAVLGGLTSDRYSLAQSQGEIVFNRDTTPPHPRFDASILPRQAPSIDARALIDRANTSAAASRMLQRASEGALVGGFVDDRGSTFAVMGSSVTGLRYEPIKVGGVRPVELGAYDWRRLTEDQAEDRLSGLTPGDEFPRFGEREEDGLQPLEGDAAKEPSSPDRIDMSIEGTGAAGARPTSGAGKTDRRVDYRLVSPEYDSIVKGLLERAKAGTTPDGKPIDTADPAARGRLRDQFDEFRSRLGVGTTTRTQGGIGAVPRAADTTKPDATRPGATKPDTTKPDVTKPATPNRLGDSVPPSTTGSGGGASSTGDDAGRPSGLTIEQMGELLRHGQTVNDLSSEQRSHLDGLIAQGQSQLADGDFFIAEQSFDRALRLMPGHPMATVGMLHTQLAAGLYLSAAINLRRLFTNSPEMIDTRYAAKLLPPPKRLDVATTNVRRLMGSSVTDRANYGLVLAYLGHQMKDTAMIRDGLDAIQGGEAEDTLRLLLKRVWLDE